MAAPTLASLLASPDRATIEQRLLLSLQGAGFPITDWESGGVERTIVEMESDALFDFVSSGIPTMVGGGFLDYAEGDWLTFLAAQLYLLERGAATFTQQTETLSSVAGTGAVTVNAGTLRFKADSGLFYLGPIITDADPGPTWTIPDGGSVTVTIQSEHPNDSTNGLNYVDPPGTITTLTTQIAGVSCENVAPDFSPVGQTGTGTGGVTPTRTNPVVAPDPHAFDIVVVDSGEIGIGTFKYRFDGGELSDEFVIPTTFDLPGLTTITFTVGVDSPSFVAGDVYNFATPGSPTISQGTDEENDGSLRARCRARWPSLSVIPVEDKYATWAKAASSQVTRVRISKDPIVPGQINLVLAGQAGAVLPAVVNTVATYIIKREGIGSLSTVASAVPVVTQASGKVYAPSSQLEAIQQTVQEQWQTVVANATTEVDLATLVQLLKDAGCTNVVLSSIKINGLAEDLVIGPTQVATLVGTMPLASALTWIAVKA